MMMKARWNMRMGGDVLIDLHRNCIPHIHIHVLQSLLLKTWTLAAIPSLSLPLGNFKTCTV